jgi:N-methylhydantoinase A
MHIRIGIDIGGTFTDLQILDERNGTLHSLKTPTTPEDPSIGLMTGIAEAAARFGFTLADIRLLLHGTTIATNAVLERRLARGVLLTTAGFEDVLEIGRHTRRDVYGLKQHQEPPLIPRDRRLGVRERMRADGSVESALEEDAIAAAIAAARRCEPEAIAITLLNANTSRAHEALLAERVQTAFPGLPVSVSSEVSPEIR